ncbi:Spx/MgsR family RNA polymerase-binding regulatory protein [Brackiella oedipodis]|uniref:Spx/MgsR family RNA polymerase-binding regulatory protein n=1 Tax=Brackiella oedipodis TaxID=124225 RepID=UPI00048F274E|nr:Spx/MgsR family RNA polymerase-binding regulatory protein [Brackiella oedipodis]
MIELYGLKNCSTCRKARQWLEEAGLDYQFIDVREQAPSASQLQQWAQALGWQRLINKASQTWRQLTENQKAQASAEHFVALLQAFPSLMKRPLLQSSKHGYLLGFKPEQYQAFFSNH